jgi:hypothetical protein
MIAVRLDNITQDIQLARCRRAALRLLLHRSAIGTDFPLSSLFALELVVLFGDKRVVV